MTRNHEKIIIGVIDFTGHYLFTLGGLWLALAAMNHGIDVGWYDGRHVPFNWSSVITVFITVVVLRQFSPTTLFPATDRYGEPYNISSLWKGSPSSTKVEPMNKDHWNLKEIEEKKEKPNPLLNKNPFEDT